MAAHISALSSTRVPNTPPDLINPIPSQVIPTGPVSLLNIGDAHRLYHAELTADEQLWRDRYSLFLSLGLKLRPRYNPGWTPSWLDTTLDPEVCEDFIQKPLYMVLDAERRSDGSAVCIKRIEPKSYESDVELEIVKTDEVKIGKYLSTEQMLRHSTNHCVPILDAFRDPIFPEVEYIVMPLLRPYNNPEFCFVGEVVDFVTQLLEGISFMHDRLVVHGDLTAQNIMMDGRPIFPGGWHFVRNRFAPNGVDSVVPLARIDHPVRYFIIDYDCSMRFSPGQSHLLEGFDGREGDPPELRNHQMYDAFKVDIFTLGHVFDKDFYQVYDGLEFLEDQINSMKNPDFRQRSTAQVALQNWLETKVKLDISMARWRLRKRDEFVGLRVMRDAVSVVQQSFDHVARMLNPQQQARV